MTRIITVKGVGKISVVPDEVVISISLETKKADYKATLELAAEKIEHLNTSLEEIGFEKKSVKTTNFNVRTEYESVKDGKENYKRVFRGYVCNHRLKVVFDLDTKRLAQTLDAISKCLAQPELSIAFTVKNPSAVNKELLKSATVNAKEKAEILCEASNVRLGSLMSIDYNWGEFDIVSRTDYDLDAKCRAMPCSGLANIDIEPDNIDVSDTATFVWEID